MSLGFNKMFRASHISAPICLLSRNFFCFHLQKTFSLKLTFFLYLYSCTQTFNQTFNRICARFLPQKCVHGELTSLPTLHYPTLPYSSLVWPAQTLSSTLADFTLPFATLMYSTLIYTTLGMADPNLCRIGTDI